MTYIKGKFLSKEFHPRIFYRTASELIHLCCILFPRLPALFLQFQLPLRAAFSQEIFPGDSGLQSAPIFPLEKSGKKCLSKCGLPCITNSTPGHAARGFNSRGSAPSHAEPRCHPRVTPCCTCRQRLPRVSEKQRPRKRDLLKIYQQAKFFSLFSLPGRMELHRTSKHTCMHHV